MSVEDRKDLPPVGSSNFLEKVREAVSTYLGNRGDKLDRGITLRDLTDSGIVTLRPGFLSGGGSGSPIGGPGSAIGGIGGVGGSAAVDFTPPPQPTGFKVSAAISNILAECDNPTYSQGGGHLRSKLYGVVYTSGALPIFANAQVVTEFTGTIGVFPTNPATSWRLWLKWVTVAGVESLTPAGGTNGLLARTGEDVAALLAALTGKITSSELFSTLGARIDLIDAASGVAGSVNARVLAEANNRVAALNQEVIDRGTAISNEASIRIAGDNALANSISLVTAGVAGAFDVGQAWYFDASSEGWTSTNASAVWNAGVIELTSTGTDPQLLSPTISVSGAAYSVVKARIKRLAGSGWDGSVLYSTSGHGFSSSFVKTIANPTLAIGSTALLEWDMSSLTTGGADWVNSTITALRMDFGSTSADQFAVDWVAIGRNAPGASQAGLIEERMARISADSAEAALRVTLAARVTTTEGNIVTNSASIANESIARANADSANASATSVIQAQLAPGGSTSNAINSRALITYVDAAKADAISTSSTASQTLFSSIKIGGRNLLANSFNYFPFRSFGSDSGSPTISNNTATETPYMLITLTANPGFGNAYFYLARTIPVNKALFYTLSFQYRASTAVRFDYFGDNPSHSQGFVQADAPASSEWKNFSLTTTTLVTGLGAQLFVITWLNGQPPGSFVELRLLQVEEGTIATAWSDAPEDRTAALQVEATTRASQDGLLFAQYTVKLDVNGYVSGYGLASTATNAAPTSSFIVRADTFSIASPSGPGITPIIPFIVQTTPTTINGVAVPVGIYANDAYLMNGTITNAKIGNAAIDDAKVANLSAAKLTVGDGTVGGILKNASQVSGVSGWILRPNGTAEFGAASIRGLLLANQIDARGLTIRNATGDILLNASGNGTFSGTVTGLIGSTPATTVESNSFAGIQGAATAQIRADDAYTQGFAGVQSAANAQATANTALTSANNANNGLATKFDNAAQTVLAGPGGFSSGNLLWNGAGVRVSGYGVGFSQNGIVAYKSNGSPTFILDGATGDASFSGVLSAATGTFAGDISAATGTFSGTVTAMNGVFVNTVNIAGDAVTVPASGSTSCSLNMPVSGNVYVSANVWVYESSGNSQTDPSSAYSIVLLVDGVPSGGYGIQTSLCSRHSMASTAAVFAVSAGVHTFSLAFTPIAGFFNLQGATMMAQGAKR